MADTKCCWHESKPCQFPGSLVKFENKMYCRFHLPLRPNNKPSAESFQELVGTRADLEGVQFPRGSYNFRRHEVTTNLNHCVFGDGVELIFGCVEATAEHARFLGKASLRLSSRTRVSVDRSVFEGPLTLRATNDARTGDCRAVKWSFRKATFNSTADFRAAIFVESLCLDDVTFFGPTQFDGAEFPQQTTAHRLRFVDASVAPDLEGSFRAARIEFSKARNRELEGRFYMWEKRCHRLGLPLKNWRSWLPRSISALYDWISGYGQSYEKAFTWLVVTQVAFALGYSVASGSFNVPGRMHSTAVSFAASQVVKPFELLSSRYEPTGTFKKLLGDSPSDWWIFWTTLHSLISLSLLGLFVLALRWRFRRE